MVNILSEFLTMVWRKETARTWCRGDKARLKRGNFWKEEGQGDIGFGHNPAVRSFILN